MCLLTYYPPGVHPDTGALEIGAQNNPDGYGYGIVDTGQDAIIVRRSMDADKLIEEFESMRKKHPEGPALFHSRIGTGGTIDRSNCHPFKVGNDPRVVVAHNGIMPSVVQPRKGDPRSDTRIFAETHLPYRNFTTAKGQRKLGRWLGTDKIVILSVHPYHPFSAKIINEERGQWVDQIWYSNSSFEDSWGHAYGQAYAACLEWKCWKCWSETRAEHNHYSYKAQADCPGCAPLDYPPVGFDVYADLRTRDPGSCIGCAVVGQVSMVTQICTLCLTCNDCGGVSDGAPASEQDTLCQCYTPASMRERSLGLDVADDWPDDEELSDGQIRDAVAELFRD